jgi:hypothetical protein
MSIHAKARMKPSKNEWFPVETFVEIGTTPMDTGIYAG